MQALLALSRGIDAVNLRVGRAVSWVTLLVVLVSTGNAIMRKFFHDSSNAWLELQWYMFGAMFLLTAGYAAEERPCPGGHHRLKLSRRAQIGIEIFGVLFFLMPACLLIMYLSWPVFMDSYLSNEYSSNSGGLIRWPVKLLIPVGFALLALAGLSHLIVRGLPGRALPRPARARGPRAPRKNWPRKSPAKRRRASRRTERTEREGPLTMEFLIANLAPIMFATPIGFLLLGFPVAFALAANGILFGLVGMELGLLNSSLFQALPQRVFGIISNDTLLAVPFFTLMGLVLERSGMAEDLLETIGQLFRHAARRPDRGRFVGAMLAATTGVVSASVISMGLISPHHAAHGYDRRLLPAASSRLGTLSQIIPPSLVLIILADQLGRSIGDIYRAAMVPVSSWGGHRSHHRHIARRSALPGRGASFPGAEWRPGGARCWC